MTDNKATYEGLSPGRIDINSRSDVQEWAKKLDVTEIQLRDAVAQVGDLATEVEMYLKGSRSTTNSERVSNVKY